LPALTPYRCGVPLANASAEHVKFPDIQKRSTCKADASFLSCPQSIDASWNRTLPQSKLRLSSLGYYLKLFTAYICKLSIANILEQKSKVIINFY
jgi:hypothetical protein